MGDKILGRCAVADPLLPLSLSSGPADSIMARLPGVPQIVEATGPLPAKDEGREMRVGYISSNLQGGAVFLMIQVACSCSVFSSSARSKAPVRALPSPPLHLSSSCLLLLTTFLLPKGLWDAHSRCCGGSSGSRGRMSTACQTPVAESQAEQRRGSSRTAQSLLTSTGRRRALESCSSSP